MDNQGNFFYTDNDDFNDTNKPTKTIGVFPNISQAKDIAKNLNNSTRNVSVKQWIKEEDIIGKLKEDH